MDRNQRDPHLDPARELLVDLVARTKAAPGADLDTSFERLVAARPEHEERLRALRASWLESGETTFVAAPAVAASEPVLEALVGRLKRVSPEALHYEVGEEIARGAMGSIRRVWDGDLQRHLAMKVILDEEAPRPGELSPSRDPQAVARFLEEALVTGQLDHPGIVPVHQLGLDERGRAYFTMKLVIGETLYEVMRRMQAGDPEWSLARVLTTLQRVCEAMAYAHDKGVIHRDLKPSNVMLGRFGEVFVMDWGLARVEGESRGRSGHQPSPLEGEAALSGGPRASGVGDSDSPLLTADGDVLGTPAFMSPEQAQGHNRELGARSDVYSVGAMLYQVLCGVAPYSEGSPLPGARALLARLQAGPPLAIERLAPATPPELVAICDKAMSRDAERRYASMSSLAEDLRAYLEGRVVSAHRTGALIELRKWVQRNRALAATGIAASLAVVAGMSAVLIVERNSNLALASANETIRSRNQALEAANGEVRAQRDDLERANEELAGAHEEVRVENHASERVIELLTAMFEQASPDMHGGVLPSAVEVLQIGDELFRDGQQQDVRVSARLAQTLCQTFESMGMNERALELARLSATAYEASAGPNSEGVYRARINEVINLHALGRREEAVELGLGLLDGVLASLGQEHPLRARLMGYVGFALADVGRAQEAIPLLEEATEQLARLGPDQSGLRWEVSIGLGRALLRAGQIKRGRDLLETTCDALAQAQGPDERILYEARTSFAEALRWTKEFARAREQLEWLVARDERIYEPLHPRRLQTRLELGLLLAEMGRIEEATGVFEDVYLAQQESGEGPTVLGRTAIHLARAYAAAGRNEDVQELLREEAEEIEEGRPVGELLSDLAILLELGRAERALGRGARAEAHASMILDRLEAQPQLGVPEKWLQAYSLQLLAEVGEDAGRIQEAAASWDEAAAVWADMGPEYESGVRMARDGAARLRRR